jgi:predicted AlkP superfamily phosphohydrolase/phosphomutase
MKKAKSFWDYTSDAGVESIIIDCPVTFPPDKIKGRMLSGMGVPDILGTEGTFTFYTTRAGGVNDDVGGQVLRLEKSNKTESYLVGPKVAKGKGAENVKVPMEIEINDDKKSIKLVYQGKEVELGEKQWSDWQEVTFKLDWLKKVRGVFKFYPVEVEPDLRLYVSPINYDPRDPVYPISYPKKYSQELAEAIGWYHTQGLPIDTWAVNENRLDEEALLEQAEEVFAERKSMLDYELEKSDKGILYVYFGSPDTVQHMFWRFRDEDHPLYDKDAPEEYRTKIEQWYEKLDGVLGEVMEKVGDEDLLIVLSDHGFNTFRRSVNLNTWLRKNGYLQLKDPQAAVGGELLAEIDWSKTKAYAVGFGGIYLNLEGREGQGVVKPGEEAEVLKNELAKKLEDWLDEKTGKSVVSRVYDGKEIFWGEEAKGMPDLYVGFNVGYRASWQTALGGVPEELIEDNMLEWSGTHLVDPELVPGVLLVNKPGVKEKPSILDVAPTILKYVGFEGDKLAGEDFDGTPLL